MTQEYIAALRELNGLLDAGTIDRAEYDVRRHLLLTEAVRAGGIRHRVDLPSSVMLVVYVQVAALVVGLLLLLASLASGIG